MRIGFFGGTFDPIHLGHILTARDALEAVGLDRLFFVVAGQNPLKEAAPRADAADRLGMVEAALKGQDKLGALDIELRRPGPSYTVDTMRELAAQHHEDERFWLLGADQFRRLDGWRDPEEMASLVRFLVLARPGHRLEAPTVPGLRWEAITERLIGISSTEIRERRSRRLPIDFFVPHRVLHLIETRNLYT